MNYSNMPKCLISLVAGTRPNIVKLAPLVAVLGKQGWCQVEVVYIAQHTSPSLSDEIFEDLHVSRESVRVCPLDGDNYGERLGRIISIYSEYIAERRPHLIVCFGDVDVTLGSALAAKRSGLPLAHIEAGLRSGDMSMPEEMNRLLVDSISDLYFAPSEDAYNNLIFGEATDPSRVIYAGNIMIDSLVATLRPELQQRVLTEYGVIRDEFAIATFHRPSNVDSRESLEYLVGLLARLSKRCKVVLPLHPRTRASLIRHGFLERLSTASGVAVVEATRYKDFVNLLANARLVITDSGGIQEEATYLGVPCLTYRNNTERPVTVRYGTNQLVNRYDIDDTLEWVLRSERRKPVAIPLWDGRTAYRIADTLRQWWDSEVTTGH